MAREAVVANRELRGSKRSPAAIASWPLFKAIRDQPLRGPEQAELDTHPLGELFLTQPAIELHAFRLDLIIRRVHFVLHKCTFGSAKRT